MSAFSDIITLTRASTGGRFNAKGVFEMVPANQPRIDYDPATLQPLGLLVEEQRTNLLLYSGDFSNAAWAKTRATITTSAVPGPSGTNLQKLVEDTTASNSHYFSQSISGAVTGSSYACTVYARAAERTWIALGVYGAAMGSVSRAYFNLSTGAFGSIDPGLTGSFKSLGNGLFAISLSRTTSASGAVTLEVALASGNGGNVYSGDGVSGALFWVAQNEIGTFPTSYIPTTTAQVTRAADVVSVNMLSWFNPLAGTIVAEADAPGLPAGAGTLAPYMVNIEDGTVTNRIGLYRDGSTGNSGYVISSAGNPSVDFNTARGGILHKSAGAYALNDFAVSANGLPPATRTSGYLPSGLNRMMIGQSAIGRYWNGHIRRIRYFPRRLSNADLQALTA